jgi:hypothetical protein
MSRMRRMLGAAVPVAAACVTLAVSAAPASASVNVVTAINQQNLHIGATGAVQRLKRLETTDRKDPTKLYHAFDQVAARFAHAATVVSHSSVDSARQATGRHDFVTATRDLSGALYKLGHAFHLIARHTTGPEVDRLLLAAERTTNRAEKLGRRADRLLGVNFSG